MQMSGPIGHPGILVGVDGWPAAKYAVDWAAREAAMRNVRLTLVHAVRPIGTIQRHWRRRRPSRDGK